jgi:N6-adenosine-specific RNA methylase IME4
VPTATPLPTGPFSLIAADPPWKFKAFSDKGLDRSAERHYPTMKLADIKALPVSDIAAKDCHLFLWTTGPHMPQALEVMKSWGFKYSGIGFVWIKLNKGAPAFWMNERDFFTGMGYTTRKNAEICLLGRRGSPKRLRKDIHELIIAPRREHSRKPAQFHERAEQYAPGPYLEMFSREPRPNWTAWGNDTEKFGGTK